MSLLRELSCNVRRAVRTTGLLRSSRFRWSINSGTEGAGGGVLAKLLFPQESECIASWTSPDLFVRLIVHLQVNFQLSLLSPGCVRPARLHTSGMRPTRLTPVSISGTSGSDRAMPQVTPAESESLRCKNAAMHHWRRKWHSRATGQIVAKYCVARDHSCKLDLHFLLLRTRAGHALAAGRDGDYQEQLQKPGLDTGDKGAPVVWLILVQQSHCVGHLPAHSHSCQYETRRSIQCLGNSLSSYLWSPLKGPVTSKWAGQVSIPWIIHISEYPVQLGS